MSVKLFWLQLHNNPGTFSFHDLDATGRKIVLYTHVDRVLLS